MTSRALIIGGSGQIGRASALALAEAGFSVTVAHRGSRALPSDFPAESIVLDRDDTAAFARAAAGSDLVVDTVAYSPAHATQFARIAGEIGSAIVISTGSVYLGRNGFAFETATNDDEYPDFPDPLTEDCPTINTDRPTYGAVKAAMERSLLAIDGLDVSILRPGATHGPGSPKLREFYFIKRVLDGRQRVVLSRGGASRFSTSSTLNIAALVAACARTPGSRVLNATDSENYTTAQLAASIFSVMGHEAEILTFEGPAIGDLGATPWDAARPYACSMELARTEVGYEPAVTYEQAVAADLEWLQAQLAAGRTWQQLFPSVVTRYGERGWFPYAEEDQWAESQL